MVNGKNGMADELTKLPPQRLLDYLTRQDELLVMLIQLMRAMAQKMGVTVYGAPGGGGAIQVSGGNIGVGGIDLSIGGYELLPEQQIFKQEGCRVASTAYYPQNLADCKQADNVLIILNSHFDQDVTVQAIGAVSQQADAENTFNLEASQTLTAGELLGITINMDNLWYPYIGVSVTTGATPPTTGLLDAWVYQRRKR